MGQKIAGFDDFGFDSSQDVPGTDNEWWKTTKQKYTKKCRRGAIVMKIHDLSYIAETALVAIAFCTVFLAGKRIHPLRAVFPDRRTTLSFCAGMSVAYVFVRVMPELQEARHVFKETAPINTPLEGMIIHYAALLGFLVFYGLEKLAQHLRIPDENKNKLSAFRLDVGGFAIYVWLMSYLLLNSLDHAHYSKLFYGVAITLHFLTVDHALRHEYGQKYDNLGRYVLAGSAIAGWISGILLPWPPYVIAPLVALTSGSIIMTSMLSELSHDEDGRVVSFILGGMVYGMLLLPFG